MSSHPISFSEKISRYRISVVLVKIVLENDENSHVITHPVFFALKISRYRISVVQVKIVMESDDYSHVLSSNFLFLEDLSLQDLCSSGQNCTGKRLLFSCPRIQFPLLRRSLGTGYPEFRSKLYWKTTTILKIDVTAF